MISKLMTFLDKNKLLVFVVVLVAVYSLFSSQVRAWPVKAMNDTINSANFIVGRGCSGTLISLKYRLILTNHHCVTGAIVSVRKKVTDANGVVSQIEVEELQDMNVSQRSYDKHQIVGESSYRAQLVARWKDSDLALLQVRAELPHAIAVKVFSGDEVYRGEEVYAVGNPYGLDATVTKGIISSTTRMFRMKGTSTDTSFLQMDAGIAPGNSGGSLFNYSGELIGVPAAGIPNTHLGLAIPFFRIQEFLTGNCYGEVWNNEAAPYDICIAIRQKLKSK